MKSLKYLFTIAVLTGALAVSAKADLVLSPFGDIPKNGTGIGGGNSDNQENNFFRLVNYIAANPTFGSLGTPTMDGAEEVTGDLSQPVDLTGFCYAVVHYGSGPDGTPGGGVAFFQITNNSDTFPQSGSGPNGFGGISRVDLFKCVAGVPDSGTTAMLLGGALCGLALGRRYLKR
jgi:VPDSG-CTERM motif